MEGQKLLVKIIGLAMLAIALITVLWGAAAEGQSWFQKNAAEAPLAGSWQLQGEGGVPVPCTFNRSDMTAFIGNKKYKWQAPMASPGEIYIWSADQDFSARATWKWRASDSKKEIYVEETTLSRRTSYILTRS